MNLEQTLRILMGAFLVQGLLAIITWWPSSDGPAQVRDLVEFDASDVTSITVTGTVQRGEMPDTPVVLKRTDSGWQIPSMFGVEVLETKIESLLETIDKLEARRPIAENAYRHVDLDVADDQHARKLVIEKDGGEPVTVYFGSATGNAAHVRLAGENEVYKIRGVAGYSISTASNQYFDRKILDVDTGTVNEVAVARPDGSAFTFTKTDVGWDVSIEGPPGRVLDSIKASEFIGKLLTVEMREPIAQSTTPEMGFDSGTVVSWTTTEEGSTVSNRYVVGNQIDGDSGRFYLKIDGKNLVYDVMSPQVENATTKPLTSLFVVQ
ncbi:MAG: DUF4340 domain-containing protein [Myxococcota bacterium]